MPQARTPLLSVSLSLSDALCMLSLTITRPHLLTSATQRASCCRHGGAGRGQVSSVEFGWAPRDLISCHLPWELVRS